MPGESLTSEQVGFYCQGSELERRFNPSSGIAAILKESAAIQFLITIFKNHLCTKRRSIDGFGQTGQLKVSMRPLQFRRAYQFNHWIKCESDFSQLLPPLISQCGGTARQSYVRANKGIADKQERRLVEVLMKSRRLEMSAYIICSSNCLQH